jgi:hypothetical protein
MLRYELDFSGSTSNGAYLEKAVTIRQISLLNALELIAITMSDLPCN